MVNLTFVPITVWLTVLVHAVCFTGAIIILAQAGHSLARMMAAFILVCSSVYFFLLVVMLVDQTPFSLYMHGPTANQFFQVSTYYGLVNALINLIIVWLCSPFGNCMLVCKNEVIR